MWRHLNYAFLAVALVCAGLAVYLRMHGIESSPFGAACVVSIVGAILS